MNKTALALMAACVLSLCLPLRAEDDDAEEPKESATSAAAAAARNKGYKTDETQIAPSADDEAPVERHSDPRTLTQAPPQRPLGAAERRAASAAGGASSGAGGGISCDKSSPPLTRVIREERPNLLRGTNKIEEFVLGPNEAISYKFIAQKSGWGGFQTNEGTNARRVSTLLSVSETPCDFDAAKALAGSDQGGNAPRRKSNPCYAYAIGPGAVITVLPEGQVVSPGKPTNHLCVLKPGKVYYFNIRSFAANPNRDACAESAKTMGPNLKCGGIWQFIGSEAGGAEKK